MERENSNLIVPMLPARIKYDSIKLSFEMSARLKKEQKAIVLLAAMRVSYLASSPKRALPSNPQSHTPSHQERFFHAMHSKPLHINPYRSLSVQSNQINPYALSKVFRKYPSNATQSKHQTTPSL
jgi:hypothetical protein